MMFKIAYFLRDNQVCIYDLHQTVVIRIINTNILMLDNNTRCILYVLEL